MPQRIRLLAEESSLRAISEGPRLPAEILATKTRRSCRMEQLGSKTKLGALIERKRGTVLLNVKTLEHKTV